MKRKSIPIIAGILLLFSQHLIAAQTSLVVIVDASWGMSLEKEGQSAMASLKTGLLNFIATIDRSTLLGLVICGNTEENGCGASLTEMPPALLNESNRHLYEEAIKNLSPKGELSLSKALNAAISTLSIMETEQMIILVAGRGEEGCSFTPCEDMKRILPQALPLSVHAISIDGSGELARSHMQCLARNGKGLWLTAKTPEDVNAAIKQVLGHVNSNLKVYVTLSKGAGFSGNLKTTLFNPDDRGPYQEYSGHPAFFSAPPGAYRLHLECTGNQVNMVKDLPDILVPETGEKTVDVNLDLGMADISVTLCGNREPPQKLVTHIFRSENKEEEIGQSDLVPLTYYLAPGTYDFMMEIDHLGFKETIRSEGVSIMAGKKTYRSVNLNLGELALTAYENQKTIYQGPAKITLYRSDAKDQPFLSSDAYPKSLYLPQGTYDLLFEIENQTRKGALWKKGITISSGEKTSEFVTLSLGELKVTVDGAPSESGASPLKSRIFTSGSMDAPVYETDQNPFTVLLPAGKYDIHTEVSGTIPLPPVIEKEILIIPGQTIEKIIDSGLKTFEVHFYSESDLDISEFVSTTLYKKGNVDTPLTFIESGPVNLILPMGEYDLKFDVSMSEKKKVFWRKNVTITEDPLQSFSVSFPDF